MKRPIVRQYLAQVKGVVVEILVIGSRFNLMAISKLSGVDFPHSIPSCTKFSEKRKKT